MKHLMKWSSLLTMVLLLAMGTMFTACDDDDDNGDWPDSFNQTFSIDGNDYPINEVGLGESNANGVDYYIISLRCNLLNKSFNVSLPKASLNKLLDLTKDQTVNRNSPVTVIINGSYAYGDEAFEAGSTLKVSISGNNIQIVAKGKALKEYNIGGGIVVEKPLEVAAKKGPGEFKPYTFAIEYSGPYSKLSMIEK